ncbi:MAG: phosphoenolpyruvate--protein phosphotransferase [Candidatus Glassbacteria bacterium]|nr:phosphoenolpyruvate--protein phosphotransferase [Candidatus Glassbacteria bacterium]
MPTGTGGTEMKSGRRGKAGEIVVSGQAASPGVVIGKAFVIPHGLPVVPVKKLEAGEEVEDEVRRFRSALDTTSRQLVELQDNLKKKLSDQTTRIFDAHLQMIEDVMAVDQTIGLIREKRIGAEQAFTAAIDNIVKAIEAHQQDQYLRERLEDIRDVERRVLENLLGICDISRIRLKERVVLIAHDLTPSQTAQLERDRILGCATDVGGTTSHTAILSRSLEIPSVVGLGDISRRVQSGDKVVVDGFSGRVVINPKRRTIEEYYSKDRRYKALEDKLAELVSLPSNTIDGRFVELSANIEFPEEVTSVISHGAKGVGLFRTEFLYLTRESLPTEQEQYLAYTDVARRLKPDPVIIRTLDAGADKFSRHFQSAPDPNPFLGDRAIRICLKHKDIFRTQLRAIFRATVHGNIKILLPFISTIEELKKSLAFIRRVRRELEAEKVPMAGKVEVGIMIEVPSAAMMADEFVRYIDFISIGTNDLIQYVMAADRGNERVASLYQPLNPAVIRLIHQVITAAKRHDTWVGVCGEMAGYPHTALLLIGLGVDELSTSPAAIPGIKKIIRSISYQHARRVADKVLSLNSVGKIKNYLLAEVEEIDKGIKGLYGE